jgi:hypothetical protein
VKPLTGVLLLVKIRKIIGLSVSFVMLPTGQKVLVLNKTHRKCLIPITIFCQVLNVESEVSTLLGPFQHKTPSILSEYFLANNNDKFAPQDSPVI